MDESQVVCCLDQKRWTLVGPAGTNPCGLPGQTGSVTSAEDILATEIDTNVGPVVTPMMLVAGGVVFITLIGLTFVAV